MSLIRSLQFAALLTSLLNCLISTSLQPEEDAGNETVREPQSVLQPIIDAVKYCKTWQMAFLYAPTIFTGYF